MPQMGESIAEGTIVRWIKNVGDSVDRDEPLFEISTDKVDAEIPAPVAGVLTEIKVQAGETVAVNEVVATIGDASEVAGPVASAASSDVAKASEAAKATAAAQPQADGAGPAQKKVPATPKPNGREAAAHAPAPPVPPKPLAKADPSAPLTQDEVRRQKSSPLVRRIAKEHNVDVSQIHGSGLGGRVTKHDILGYIESPQPQAQRLEPKYQSQEPKAEGLESRAPSPEPKAPVYREGDRIEIEPLSVMRKRIAEHMVMSRRTAAHVHSGVLGGFAAVGGGRGRSSAVGGRAGARRAFGSFRAGACCEALRA
jgi:2-oxoglutarate dehydrogenase E2 component (dihydrolipoamide succinyltransferase)